MVLFLFCQKISAEGKLLKCLLYDDIRLISSTFSLALSTVCLWLKTEFLTDEFAYCYYWAEFPVYCFWRIWLQAADQKSNVLLQHEFVVLQGEQSPRACGMSSSIKINKRGFALFPYERLEKQMEIASK